MKQYLLLLAILGFFAMSCTKDVYITEPYGNFIGRMTGRIIPLDVNGDSMTSVYAGTNVWLEGTSLRSTSTSTGQWTLDSVPAGIYTIRFSKPGFDTIGFERVTFSGAGVEFFNDLYVVRMPTDSIVLDMVSTGDTTLYGNTYPCVRYAGHISSNQRQLCAISCTADSTSSLFAEVVADSVIAGRFHGSIMQALDLHTMQFERLAHGHQVFLRAQLLPTVEYSGVSGYVTNDRSNTLSVLVP